MFIFVTLLVSNLSPKSKLVIALYPVFSNILTIPVTLLVSNLSPKFKLVIASYPVFLNILVISVTLLVSNLSPKSKLVIASFPVAENILLISVTLLVSNLSPRFKFVIASCPVLVNISSIFVTLLVSKFPPKSKLVIYISPQCPNILLMFVTLDTFSKSIFVIGCSPPTIANKLLEFWFANISKSLPMCTLLPLSPFSAQAIIDLSCWADTSHAVSSTYSPVTVLYTVSGIFVSKVTFITLTLGTLPPKNPINASFSSSALLNVL